MLLDYRMPEMDGLEVARRVLSGRLPRTRNGHSDGSDYPMILMLTSDDLNAQLAELHENRLDAYLIKPIKRIELLETIGRLLNGVRALPAQSIPEPPDGVPTDERRLRILLAEDAPDNRLLIKAYFKNLPYELEMVEDGRLAVDKFKAAAYDLVLMDIQMPVMDGLTATRAMRQWEKDRKRAPTPIIALTASALEDDLQRSLEAGCDAHLSKPVRKSTLLEAIRRFVGPAKIGAPADPATAATASTNAR
jgi:two-component system, sensor histidine kinase and response regulator